MGSGVLPGVKPGLSSSKQRQNSTSNAAVADRGTQTTYSKIKVRYFQMSAALPGVSEEYFTLPSPADYRELSDAVLVAHPTLSSMMSNMLVLVDGVVARDTTPLKDGDEVDFIPATAGG